MPALKAIAAKPVADCVSISPEVAGVRITPLLMLPAVPRPLGHGAPGLPGSNLKCATRQYSRCAACHVRRLEPANHWRGPIKTRCAVLSLFTSGAAIRQQNAENATGLRAFN